MFEHEPEELAPDDTVFDEGDTLTGLLGLTDEFFRQASPQVRAELALFLTIQHGWHPETGLHAYLDSLGFAALGLRGSGNGHRFVVRSRCPAGTPAPSWWTLAPPRAIAWRSSPQRKGQAVAPGVTGNEKKFRALVDDFVSTTAELGGTIDPEIVAIELRQRIQFIATQIGVSEATVLRTYMDKEWAGTWHARPTGKSKNATPTSTPHPTSGYRCAQSAG